MRILSLIILIFFEVVFVCANFDKKDKTDLTIARIIFLAMLIPTVYILNN